jgi:putative sterol carrier protein
VTGDPSADGQDPVRFLSAAWVDAFNRALEGAELPEPGPEAGLATAGGRFAVAQAVHGTPDGDVRVVMTYDNGTLHLERLDGTTGQPVTPDVTIALSYEDAAAMSTGDLSPAEALTAGRIRVRGDLGVLLTMQQTLAAARSSTRSLADITTY